VRLMVSGPEGKDKVVELFEPGGMFGEIGVFTGECYRTWTQAVGAVVLVLSLGSQVNQQLSDLAGNLAWLVIFFVLAFFLYASLYAALGAAAEDEQHLG